MLFLPDTAAVKVTRRLSGVQARLLFVPSKVRRKNVPRAISWTQMSKVPFRLRREPATRCPSGESATVDHSCGGAGIRVATPFRSLHSSVDRYVPESLDI